MEENNEYEYITSNENENVYENKDVNENEKENKGVNEKENGKENEKDAARQNISLSTFHLSLSSLLVVVLLLCIAGYWIWQSAAERRNEERSYSEAMLSSNVQDMKDYLVEYNDAPTEHRDSVRNRLESFLKEDADWTNTLAAMSKKRLEDFISAHPLSLHKGEAENLIDSIDFSTAQRKGTTEAYNEYLKMHPDSRWADAAREYRDEKKTVSATSEEKAMAHEICKRFLQAINARNAEKLSSMTETIMTSFQGKANAEAKAAKDYMNSLYADDVKNLNWHILGDFDAVKALRQGENAGKQAITTSFSAELKKEYKGEKKPTTEKFRITMKITPEKKVKSFNALSMEHRTH